QERIHQHILRYSQRNHFSVPCFGQIIFTVRQNKENLSLEAQGTKVLYHTFRNIKQGGITVSVIINKPAKGNTIRRTGDLNEFIFIPPEISQQKAASFEHLHREYFAEAIQ